MADKIITLEKTTGSKVGFNVDHIVQVEPSTEPNQTRVYLALVSQPILVKGDYAATINKLNGVTQ